MSIIRVMVALITAPSGKRNFYERLEPLRASACTSGSGPWRPRVDTVSGARVTKCSDGRGMDTPRSVLPVAERQREDLITVSMSPMAPVLP